MEHHSRLQGYAQRYLPLILSIFILIQPLLDILTALGVLAGHSVTAGVVVRTLFMAFSFLYTVFVSSFPEKKRCLIFMGVLIAYLALFMVYMFSLGGISLCISNAKDLIKVFFAPFVFLFLYAVYREHGHFVSSRTLAWTSGIYTFVILFAAITGTSFVSYANSGYGYKGWFYAANEVSSIIALTAPIAIYYCLTQLPGLTKKVWWKLALIVVTFISIIFSANYIGTKIVFGFIVLYCMAAAVWSLVRWFQLRDSKMMLRAIVTGVLAVLTLALYFTSPLQSYTENIYLEIMDKDSELVSVSWDEESQIATSGTWLRNLIQENAVVQKLDQILSRRLFTASPSVQVYTEGGLAAKLLGIGYTTIESYGRKVEYMIEMDPISILIRHGVIGFCLYYLPYLASVVYAIVQFFKRPAKRLSSLKYCTYLYTTLCAFAISMIAGHALVSPAVSIFVLLVSFRLWILTQEQNSLPA